MELNNTRILRESLLCNKPSVVSETEGLFYKLCKFTVLKINLFPFKILFYLMTKFERNIEFAQFSLQQYILFFLE